MTIAIHELGEGPPVVLLHAFPCDRRMWLPQAHRLAEMGWRAVLVDLPGFGQSALLPVAPSLDAVADSIHDALLVRGIDRCILAGVSLGGYVAMALVRAHPELAAALILCDTKATADGDQAVANRERLATAVEAEPGRCARILEQSVLPGLLGESTFADRADVVDRVRAWLAEADASTVAWYQRAMAARPDSQAVLAGLALPTLVVRGEQDALSSHDEALLMVATSPDARLVTVPGVGHLANVEDPVAVGDEVVRFVDLVTGPRTS